MWARIIEFMLAIWLGISAFIFDYPEDTYFFVVSDLITSTLITIFSLTCYYRPLRKLHLLNLLIACYLIGLSYFFRDANLYEPLQNFMVIGLLLLMIAIVPTDAEKPPNPG